MVFIHGAGKQTRNHRARRTIRARQESLALVDDKRGVGKSGGEYERQPERGRKVISCCSRMPCGCRAAQPAERPRTDGAATGFAGISQAGSDCAARREEDRPREFLVSGAVPLSAQVTRSRTSSAEFAPMADRAQDRAAIRRCADMRARKNTSARLFLRDPFGVTISESCRFPSALDLQRQRREHHRSTVGRAAYPVRCGAWRIAAIRADCRPRAQQHAKAPFRSHSRLRSGARGFSGADAPVRPRRRPTRSRGHPPASSARTAPLRSTRSGACGIRSAAWTSDRAR